MTHLPVFIVGCGRSGTSLLRRFLNQHPVIGIPLESLFIVDYLQASTHTPIDRMLPLMVHEPELAEWGIYPKLEDAQDCRSPADAIDRFHQLYLAPQNKARWGQKTPRFVRHLPLLHRHFPDGRFIHLVRDPRAVAASLIRSNVHRSTAYYAARRWRMDVDFGLAFEQSAPGAVLRLAYEELVTQPERVLRRVCQFCALDFDPVMLASPKTGEAEYSNFYAQIHANVDRPATQDSVDRWANELSPQQIALIELEAGERMEQLGFKRAATVEAELPSTWVLRAARFKGMAQQSYRYVRYRPRYLAFLLYRKARLGLLKSFLWSVNY